MSISRRIMWLAAGLFISTGLLLQGCSATGKGSGGPAGAAELPQAMKPYFTRDKKAAVSPDADGFLRRWLLLEPINKPNRTNTVFTDSYLRTAFTTEYFPKQFTVVPRDSEKVKV